MEVPGKQQPDEEKKVDFQELGEGDRTTRNYRAAGDTEYNGEKNKAGWNMKPSYLGWGSLSLLTRG